MVLSKRRVWHSLAFQASVTVLLAWGLLLLGMYFGNYRALQKSLTANLRMTIAQTSQLINTSISAASHERSGELATLEIFFNEMVDTHGESGIVYVLIVRSDGVAALSAGMKLTDIPQPDSVESLDECALRGICHIRDPILLSSTEIGYQQYGVSTQAMTKALAQVNANSFTVTTLVTLFIFGAISAFGLRIARRAARISKATEAMAGSNYKVRVKVAGHDELSDLSVNFNRMADAVEAHMAEITNLKESLEARVVERTSALEVSNGLLSANIQQLHSAQQRLVKSEKLAGLGAMVAGVSHELNTPLGNALVSATAVQDATRVFAELVEKDKVTRGALRNFVQTALEGVVLIERSVRRAADLVVSFKSIAIDQSAVQRRQFDLAQTLSYAIVSCRNGHKLQPEQLVLVAPEGLAMDSFPEPLVQVIVKLVDNALAHAFDDVQAGKMRVFARAAGSSQVCIEFSDNGRGIPSENITRIFNPFFTTRLGHGGNGLGLNIVNNLVEGVLGGSIQVDSQLGIGTRFVIELPMTAPSGI